jgi:hypothetical protein
MLLDVLYTTLRWAARQLRRCTHEQNPSNNACELEGREPGPKNSSPVRLSSEKRIPLPACAAESAAADDAGTPLGDTPPVAPPSLAAAAAAAAGDAVGVVGPAAG